MIYAHCGGRWLRSPTTMVSRREGIVTCESFLGRKQKYFCGGNVLIHRGYWLCLLSITAFLVRQSTRSGSISQYREHHPCEFHMAYIVTSTAQLLLSSYYIITDHIFNIQYSASNHALVYAPPRHTITSTRTVRSAQTSHSLHPLFLVLLYSSTTKKRATATKAPTSNGTANTERLPVPTTSR